MTLALATVELAERSRAAKRGHMHLCRQSSAEMVRYVMRDDETGKPLENAPYHEEWHALAAAHQRLWICSHIESGKTTSLSIGKALHAIGTNPNYRVCVVSASMGKAGKVLRAIKGYIERSAELRDVFPALRPGTPWTDTAITVKRDSFSKDPSIQVCGTHGNVLGSRIDLLILDDILDWENVRTEAQRQKIWDWFRANFVGRMTSQSWTLAVGTPWHLLDMLHMLSKGRGWVRRDYPVISAKGEPAWPQRWPLSRIREREEELGPIESARQLHVKARAEESSRCKQEWINRCLDRGDGVSVPNSIAVEDMPPGCFAVVGVDLAVKKKRETALTVMFPLLVYPNGDKQPLDVVAGRFTGPEIRDIIIDIHNRYGAVVFVEDNGAQQYILELVGEKAAIPVQPFTTGVNKWHPAYGVESLFVEFSNGKWVIPSDGRVANPELAAWLGEATAFQPTEHSGDRLMASWIAKEGARFILSGMGGEGDVGVSVITGDDDPPPPADDDDDP